MRVLILIAQLYRAPVALLHVSFRPPLAGGLSACSGLRRRRKAMRSTLARASLVLAEFKSEEVERTFIVNIV